MPIRDSSSSCVSSSSAASAARSGRRAPDQRPRPASATATRRCRSAIFYADSSTKKLRDGRARRSASPKSSGSATCRRPYWSTSGSSRASIFGPRAAPLPGRRARRPRLLHAGHADAGESPRAPRRRGLEVVGEPDLRPVAHADTLARGSSASERGHPVIRQASLASSLLSSMSSATWRTRRRVWRRRAPALRPGRSARACQSAARARTGERLGCRRPRAQARAAASRSMSLSMRLFSAKYV